jgi:aminoglycoside phosphotransferase (APT) family kinase protein
VPTPRVLAVCEDERVVGAPFYVMEHLAGTVALLELPEALDLPDERRAIAERAVEALVAIHAVDTAAAGLELGKPSGYLQRQLDRHYALWEHSRTRELPVFDEVGRWLARNLPATEEVTLVHGDFHLGNILLAPEAPARVAAVLDWELATRGDPLADLGYLCALWTQAADPPDHPLERSTLTRRAGFPTRDELVAYYEEVSGRAVHDRDWYEILALWRAVVFMEGNYRRAAEGSTDDAFLAGFGPQVPRLAELARAAVEAADASSRPGAP